MEGFLSACYHVCPTVESFQFDTTFMYIMAVLVFLKVNKLISGNWCKIMNYFFVLAGFCFLFQQNEIGCIFRCINSVIQTLPQTHILYLHLLLLD